MTSADQIKQDLDYVASAVRRRDDCTGVPSIYFLWAGIVLVGFALPDFAPRVAYVFWLVAGIGGGLLSWWLGERDGRRTGINDVAMGRRHGLHWLVAGLAFVVAALPMITGAAPAGIAVANFLLVGGLAYALAGVHLQRPLLWSGLVMLAAYAVLVLFAPPYAWTLTGIAVAAALAWAGLSAQRGRNAGGA